MAITFLRHAKLFCKFNTEIYAPKVILELVKSLQKTCHCCSCRLPTNRKYSSHVEAEHGQKTIPRLKWKLMGALCLERPPVITSEMNTIEQDYQNMVDSMEYENSVLSEHEIQISKDRERLEQKQRGEIEDDEDSGNLMSAQDIEDLATEECNKFKLASRTTEADETGDKTTSQRKLNENLILLVRKPIGKQMVWMLPQREHLHGESLRQTAERAIFQIGTGAEVTFFGNAPIGYYKYKFPNVVKSETGAIGAKVFIFRAKIFKGQFLVSKESADEHVWVTKEELKDYLVPAYLDSVLRFIN